MEAKPHDHASASLRGDLVLDVEQTGPPDDDLEPGGERPRGDELQRLKAAEVFNRGNARARCYRQDQERQLVDEALPEQAVRELDPMGTLGSERVAVAAGRGCGGEPIVPNVALSPPMAL
jgi:hypothetical protein